jgi:hypothetical protein
MYKFLEGKKCKRGTHETDGVSYWLHGHEIIRRDKRTFIVDLCGWPTKTTFDVLRNITVVEGRMNRKAGSVYEDITLCGKAWKGEPRKLKMKEVQIAHGFPGSEPYNELCRACKLYTGNDGLLTCGHYPRTGGINDAGQWETHEFACVYRE